MESLQGGMVGPGRQCLIDGLLTAAAIVVGGASGGWLGAAAGGIGGLFAGNSNGCFN